MKTSHSLVSRYGSCVEHSANLQSVLMKHLMNGIEEFPVLRCSTIYIKTWAERLLKL